MRKPSNPKLSLKLSAMREDKGEISCVGHPKNYEKLLLNLQKIGHDALLMQVKNS